MARGSGRTDSTGKISSRMIILGKKWIFFFVSLWGERGDKPVVSHEDPGANDHRNVEWDVVLDRILSVIKTLS